MSKNELIEAAVDMSSGLSTNVVENANQDTVLNALVNETERLGGVTTADIFKGAFLLVTKKHNVKLSNSFPEGWVDMSVKNLVDYLVD